MNKKLDNIFVLDLIGQLRNVLSALRKFNDDESLFRLSLPKFRVARAVHEYVLAACTECLKYYFKFPHWQQRMFDDGIVEQVVALLKAPVRSKSSKSESNVDSETTSEKAEIDAKTLTTTRLRCLALLMKFDSALLPKLASDFGIFFFFF